MLVEGDGSSGKNQPEDEGKRQKVAIESEGRWDLLQDGDTEAL